MEWSDVFSVDPTLDGQVRVRFNYPGTPLSVDRTLTPEEAREMAEVMGDTADDIKRAADGADPDASVDR